MNDLLEIFRKLLFRGGGSADGSLLVAIEHALDRVRDGSASDESMALAANKIVRKTLDKRAIGVVSVQDHLSEDHNAPSAETLQSDDTQNATFRVVQHFHG